MENVELVRLGCRGLAEKYVYGKGAVVRSDKDIKVFFFCGLGRYILLKITDKPL